MEQTLVPLDLARPWRRATFLAGTVAAVELVLLVAAGVALLGREVAGSMESAATRRVAAPVKPVDQERVARPASVGEPRLGRRATRVLVLNGNGRTGAAAAAATEVQRLTYRVAGTGNAARTDFARTLVMFRPGYAPEAHRLARDLGVRVVAPLDGVARRELGGAHVAVVLGADR